MKKLLCIILSCSYSFLFCQRNDLESLKKLGRDSLIKLAIQKIDDPKFNPVHYDRVTVRATKTELYVVFELSINFHNKRSCFYDVVTVGLVGYGTSKSIQGDCEEPSYYHPTKSDQKKIDFVFDAINKDNSIGDIPDRKIPAGSKMEITEHFDYYHVRMDSWSTHSDYKISKITGKVYDAGHKHYARSWDTEDFEIIK